MPWHFKKTDTDEEEGPFCFHIGTAMIASISNALVNMKPYVPAEFSRKPRSVIEVK